MKLTAVKLMIALVLALLAASPAFAQLGEEIPHASYYAAVQAVYSGDYRTAARELDRETRRGVHTPQARWVDSICYYAMLGEVLYQEGRNADALAQFDQACQVLLAYPNWLLQVRFQQQPRPDPNRARRVPPWGRSQRTFVLGQFPATEQVLVGDLDAQKTLQQGGVFRSPMLWRVNVVEVVRMSALAIRRRNEILGPVGAEDPISKQLSAALSAGNLAPANHWSGTWIDLLHGLAEEGVGKLDEADRLLGRSVVIAGQFDHPLTCVALMEQGHIAAIRGDTRSAARLFAEAGYSAYYFDDWDVLTESVLNGWLNHLASGAPGIYPPLDAVATWAQANRLQHVAVNVRLAQTESVLILGRLGAGASLIEDVSRRIGEMRTGLPGIHLLYLQAMLQILQGHLDPGGEALTRAVAAQAGVSLRNFQIARTNALYDARAASARIAVEFYKSLLADPSPADWMHSPLDAMAVVASVHDAAFDRWFLAALERKDATLALEVAERAKRRRFLSAQPFGARLLELRAVLESPQADLSRDELLQRQQLLAAFPEYQTLAQAAQQICDQLRAGPLLATNGADSKPLAALYDQWDRNAAQKQHILAQLAVRRIPSPTAFPPLMTTPELQKTLDDGEALVEFHTVGEKLYGIVATKSDINVWQLPDPRRLRAGLGAFLRALGNYSANRELTAPELKSDTWHQAAKQAFAAIFDNSRLEISKTKSLVIVPDNLLWYIPFEALIPGGGKGDKVLADCFPIRYGPTAALAVCNPRPLRRVQHTGILPGDLRFAGEEPDRLKLLQDLREVVSGPLVLPQPLPQPARLVSPLLDTLIVLDDISGNTIGNPSTILPRSRSTAKDKLNAWIALPYGGAERVVITGFKTEAQRGLKSPRRESTRSNIAHKGLAAGDEVFQSLCDIMACGARTVLLSRWRTGGRTNFDLVREFAKESVDKTAEEAWQRACLLARENPIDQNHEPRLKHSDDSGDLPTADHPFFWSGYLLVDTGPRPKKPESPKSTKNTAAKNKPLPPPAKQKGVADTTRATNEGELPPADDRSPDAKSPKTDIQKNDRGKADPTPPHPQVSTGAHSRE
ncbi:MAG TPA: hypothetical protein VHE81_16920 [Lacipirellulaceae bacterium]|nr:hypothetical protein [Lacipirellulaceae bacterium]